MEPIRELQRATHFKKVRGPSVLDPQVLLDDLLTPCSPDAAGAIKMEWAKVPADKLLESTITMVTILMIVISNFFCLFQYVFNFNQ